MPNPFVRDDATWILNNITQRPRPHGNLIVTRSGRGVGERAVGEPAHVTVYLIAYTGHYRWTDLVGVEGNPVDIQIGDVQPDAGLPTDPGIFRGWDLGFGPAADQSLANALAAAQNLMANPPGNYSRMGNSFGSTWNCARYAETILRSAGLNVSAGFFVTSPLELTTGRSVVTRLICSAWHTAENPWYRRFNT